jgi:Tfp pilus assembly protein PilV
MRISSATVNSHKSGMSLIEIMIAFAILVVSAFSISGLISFGHRGTEKDFRSVLAIQLLEEKLNLFLSTSFNKVSDEVMSGATKMNVDKTLFSGTTHEIQLGSITEGKTNYQVSATLEKIPVSFGVRPLEIDQSYEFAKVETYRFGALNNKLARFDGSNNGKNRYRVIKVTMMVKWTEPVVNVEKQIQAVSFLVDLES